jgi:hypothetical protein
VGVSAKGRMGETAKRRMGIAVLSTRRPADPPIRRYADTPTPGSARFLGQPHQALLGNLFLRKAVNFIREPRPTSPDQVERTRS